MRINFVMLTAIAALCMASVSSASSADERQAPQSPKASENGCARGAIVKDKSQLVPNTSVGGKPGQFCGLPADVELLPTAKREPDGHGTKKERTSPPKESPKASESEPSVRKRGTGLTSPW